jgi:hypothetical protein
LVVVGEIWVILTSLFATARKQGQSFWPCASASTAHHRFAPPACLAEQLPRQYVQA